MTYLTVTPSYGRDYASGKAALADWDAGKDFTIADISSRWNGKQINKPQAPAGTSIRIRYARLTKMVAVP